MPRLKTRAARLLVAALAALLVVFIGFSRVFVGDHYLTDVLAGAAVGIAWGSLVLALTERYFAPSGTGQPSA
jgi:undecaprenyl-diphosphatase